MHSLCSQFEVVYPDEQFAPIYNGENLVVLKDALDVVKAYKQNGNEHAAHSHPYRSAAESVVSARASQNAGVGGGIHGHKNSKIYRLSGCSVYSQQSPSNVVTFESEAEVVEAGYRRAKNCR